MELAGSRAIQEAEEAKAKASRMEAQLVHLQAEKEIRTQTEERSREERRAWTEERMTLTGRVEELRAALATAEERASGKEAESARAAELIRATEAARVAEVSRAREATEAAEAARSRAEREATERSESLVREIREARESLAKAETSLSYERGRVSDLEGRLLVYEEKEAGKTDQDSSEATSTPSTEGASTATIASIRKEGKTIDEWVQESAQLREEVTQYRGIAEGAEAALSALQSTYDAYKADMEARAERAAQEIEGVREARQVLERTVSDIQKEGREREEAFEQEKSRLTQRIRKAEENASMAQARVEEMSGREKQLREDRDAAEARAAAASNRGTAELRARAAEAAEAAEVREQLREARDALAEAERKVTLEEAKVEAAESRIRLIQQEAKASVLEAREEKDTLAGQLDRLERDYTVMRESLARLRSQEGDEGVVVGEDGIERQGDMEMGEGSEEGMVDNLRSLVLQQRGDLDRLRLDKEIRAQECRRLQVEVDSAREEAQAARTSLAAERAKAASRQEGGGGEGAQDDTTGGTASQHAALMARIAELSVLRESNGVLRERERSASERVKLLEEEVTSLKEKSRPLEEKIGELTAQVEADTEEKARLKAERLRWQERAAEILRTQKVN